MFSSNSSIPLFGSSIPENQALTKSRNLLGSPLISNQTNKLNKQNDDEEVNKQEIIITTKKLNLNNLPSEELIILTQDLLNQLEININSLIRKEKELNSLKELCFKNGIKQEEINEVLLNALKGDESSEIVNDFDNNLSGINSSIDEGKSKEININNAQIEDLLDLDGLTEARTENAFDFSQSDFTSDDETSSSKLSNTFVLDTRHPSSRTNDQLHHRTQQRHTSLSSRLFSTSALFYSSSTTPTSSTSNSITSPTQPLFPEDSQSKSNRSRSDSVKSVDSSLSIPASVDSNSIGSVPKSNGYGEWIGWKSWSKGGTDKIKKGTIRPSEVDDGGGKDVHSVEDHSMDSLTAPSISTNVSEPSLNEATSDLGGVSPSSSSTKSQLKFRSPSLLSTATSPSSSQMLSKARSPSDTLLSPQLAPSSPSLSTSSVTPYSAQTHSIQPEENKNLATAVETPKSRRKSLQPNLTLFPKLSSLSKYSPFAQPALATPLPQVSLSSHPASPVIATIPLLPTIATSSTMELDVIPIEARPPTIQNTASKRLISTTTEPLVDRYGFVYDVRSGMKLLREARGREERRLAGEISEANSDEERLEEISPTPEEEVLQNRLDVESQIADLSKSLGLPPLSSSVSSSDISNDIIAPSTTTSPTLAPPKSARLVRTLSADSTASTSTAGGGTQSMKRLLNQLTEMHDGIERIQREAWDSFIRRRQLILSNDYESTNHSSLHGGKKAKKINSKKSKSTKILLGIENPLVEPSEIGVGKGEDGRDSDISPVWNENLVGVAQMGSSWKTGKEDWQEFKTLVKKGIPIAHRPKIWAECSGANEIREPGTYQELLNEPPGEENLCLNQIDMDCHRTFPTNVFFAGNGPGVAKLRNILVAYCRRNPIIGYCQGMNNLTATLLLVYPLEEDAFWVLVCIIEKILPSDYYTSQLLVSQADQRVLQSLVAEHLPEIAAHLEEIGVELPAICFSWFLSIFTDTLPVQTLLRIWDLLFVWGTVILFRITFAILQMHSAEILGCDSAASIYSLMRGLTTHLYQVDKLIIVACDDLRTIIKDKEVERLRSIHVEALKTELECNLVT